MGIYLGTLKLSFLSFLNFRLFSFLFVFSDVFYLGLANNLYTFNTVVLDIVYYIQLLYSVCTYKHLTSIFKISLSVFN